MLSQQITLLKTKLVPIAFANVYIIWGATFLAIAYGLQGFPPFILSGLRFVGAGIILFVWRTLQGEKLPTFSDWTKNGIAGILILTGGTGLVSWGEQFVSSTEAAIVSATGTFWFIAIDKKNWKVYFSDKLILIGLIIGFIGLLVFLQGSATTTHTTADNTVRLTAFAILGISSIFWVVGSLFSKNNKTNNSTFSNISQQLLVAAFVSFAIGAIRGEWQDFSFFDVGYLAWLGLGFLVIFGSLIAYISYIWLLTVQPPALVSTHTYINPIVAVLLGWLLANETISTLQFSGLMIILFGVLLTNLVNYLPSRTRAMLRKTYQQTKKHGVLGFFAVR